MTRGGGGQAVGTGYLWRLVRGGGTPKKMVVQLVQDVLSAEGGGPGEIKMVVQLVQKVPSALIIEGKMKMHPTK